MIKYRLNVGSDNRLNTPVLVRDCLYMVDLQWPLRIDQFMTVILRSSQDLKLNLLNLFFRYGQAVHIGPCVCDDGP